MAERAGKGSAIARVRARQFRVLPECSSPSSETLALKLQAMRESVNRLYHRPEPGEMQLARWSDLMAEAEALKSTAPQGRDGFNAERSEAMWSLKAPRIAQAPEVAPASPPEILDLHQEALCVFRLRLGFGRLGALVFSVDACRAARPGEGA